MQGLAALKQVSEVTMSAASVQCWAGQPAVVVNAAWKHVSVPVFGWLYLVLGVFLLDSHLPVWSSEPLVYSYSVKSLVLVSLAPPLDVLGRGD